MFSSSATATSIIHWMFCVFITQNSNLECIMIIMHSKCGFHVMNKWNTQWINEGALEENMINVMH